MKPNPYAITDANEAVASVAYRLTENIAIYPITPSTPMAELSDEWASAGKRNVWDNVPTVVQMQSEGGVAGTTHGMLAGGTLSTTFTASQGLLLMIPNMYKIAGELTPFCLHVTARALATHALSIFGDHSDVMACRQTGFAMLCSNNVQEAQDLAAIAHAATLTSRIPFMHFFDGFRTSHEINTYQPLKNETLLKLIDEDAVTAHHNRGLTPDAPQIRGTAQNPDVYFQGREAVNLYYDATPKIVQDAMDRFFELTGRRYNLFDYYGAADAEDVIILMGSGVETCEAVSEYLNAKEGRKTGVLSVRLLRPFSLPDFLKVLPESVKRVCVLDRTKEPGALAEPLYLDIVAALAEAPEERSTPRRVLAGRYGLGSKEFTPAMAKSVFDNLAAKTPKNHFTVGIVDDVTHTSLSYDPKFRLEGGKTFEAVFVGLGSDGTVGANKNTIKIIGTETDNCAQAYFVYDSKKSGAMTVSHLRFGPELIRAPYLIESARFLGVHQWQFVQKFDVLRYAAPGATVLINSPYPPERVWQHLPRPVQEEMIAKSVQLYTIDAYTVARDTGMGGRTNTIMQTCFFAISGILPREEAIAKIKKAIEKTYIKKGQAVVDKNFAAVDATIANLYEVPLPASAEENAEPFPPTVPASAPDFIRRVTATILEGNGDNLPVSAFPVDGTWPCATSRWEKRNVATEIPIWDPEVCIQCGKCALVCPHAAIRANLYEESDLENAPDSFRAAQVKGRGKETLRYTIQVAPEDCTGCSLCVTACPAKNRANPQLKAINMASHEEHVKEEIVNWDFFSELPMPDRTQLGFSAKETQLRQPLFEFSGACAGCGETPYIKLLTQLMGDRLQIANATGCSSIYGGNLPTTPYCTDINGRGPSWSNSLFEDNAEYAYGLRLAADKKTEIAREVLEKLAPQVGDTLAREILLCPQTNELDILAQRERVAELKRSLRSLELGKLKGTPEAGLAKRLGTFADFLVKKSVWAIGGDGWAYDIGFGGLDHVLSTGRNVNILVLDTEVYSNTGGQSSKSTPLGAVAKFSAGGKATPKKDLGLIAMGYGNVYVATVALGANERQLINAMNEADSYDGPSLVIAYSHCIAHGYNLNLGFDQQKKAVESGHWPLYRYDPRRVDEGKAALVLDSKAPTLPLKQYVENEVRYRILLQSNPARANELLSYAQERTKERRALYEAIAANGPSLDAAIAASAAPAAEAGKENN